MLHTLVFREHNRIARRLRAINPEWSDEIVFQEARKIVGAVSAKITMDDWLPHILGPAAVDAMAAFHDYNPEVNAGIANAISAAVMRFGHTLLVPEVTNFSTHCKPHS